MGYEQTDRAVKLLRATCSLLEVHELDSDTLSFMQNELGDLAATLEDELAEKLPETAAIK